MFYHFFCRSDSHSARQADSKFVPRQKSPLPSRLSQPYPAQFLCSWYLQMRNIHKNVRSEARARYSKNVPEINSARNYTFFHPKSAPKMQHLITHMSLGIPTLQSKPLRRKPNLTDICQRRPLHGHTPLYIGGIVRLHEFYPS